MNSSNRYTKEEFIKAVKNNISIRGVLIELGLAPYGGNYKTVKNNIKKYNLTTDHWKGQHANKGKKFPPKRPIEDYLENKFNIQSFKLKLRLLSEDIFEHKCSCCGRKEWNNQPIPIELDHIDGDNKNNNLDNLRLLCPNCHAQTDTYRGKNKKIKKVLKKKCSCGKEIYRKSKLCKKCYQNSQKGQIRTIPPVSKEDLQKMISELPMTKIGDHFNVSDNTIRKWCKKLEVDMSKRLNKKRT